MAGVFDELRHVSTRLLETGLLRYKVEHFTEIEL